jgi:hypothetical protein
VLQLQQVGQGVLLQLAEQVESDTMVSKEQQVVLLELASAPELRGTLAIS